MNNIIYSLLFIFFRKKAFAFGCHNGYLFLDSYNLRQKEIYNLNSKKTFTIYLVKDNKMVYKLKEFNSFYFNYFNSLSK